MAARGVRVSTGVNPVQIDGCGYADVSAVYLNNGSDIVATGNDLDVFGKMWGLRINNSKPIRVPLRPAARATLPENTRFHVLTEHGSCRYLDIQVGVQSNMNWESFYGSLRFRLSMATKKTHTVLQQVQLVWTLVVLSSALSRSLTFQKTIQ